ncbi:MAG TPA: PEGA domain-containing protein, partial [Polyangiaceae bacterium]
EAEKANVGAVSVQVDREGATVYVDGQPAGDSPVFVEPGTRTIEARRGEQRARQTIEAEAGQDYQVELELELAAPSGLPVSGLTHQGPNPTPSPEQPDSGRSLVPVYVGAGVTAVAATLAVVFALGASADADDARTLSESIGPDGCSPGGPTAADCQALSDVIDSQHGKATGFAISASVGAVAAVATVGYLLWPELVGSSRANAKRPAHPWTAEVSERGASFAVSGQF